MPRLAQLALDDTGVSALEYALILSFLAGGIAFASFLFGDSVSNVFQAKADLINSY
ncbi:MAG: hypothetical protein KQH53_05475 [Desulfarculaceae bacterium]|nr:hypothetical protein [Desulfarculaceae bacterium]